MFCVPVNKVFLVWLGQSWAQDSTWGCAELQEVAAPLQGQHRMGPFSLHRACGGFSLSTAGLETCLDI